MRPATSPLQRLHEYPIGRYRLLLSRAEPSSKSGWTRFELTLSASEGDYRPAVITGIYSVGGRGVSPWMEIMDYRSRLSCAGQLLDLATEGLDLALFRILSGMIPPGGHIMVWCEDRPQQETYLALVNGVPPVATPLGNLLFHAGFPRIKFFDLAEGGLEGQQKLWAEKPLNEAMARDWGSRTARDLGVFLAAPSDEPIALRQIQRAADTLKEIATPNH